MKEFILAAAGASVLLLAGCATSGSSSGTAGTEKKIPGEYVSVTTRRTELSEEILERSADVSDPEEPSFLLGRYAQSSSAACGCHDPKLFQDDDGTYYVYSTGWEKGVEIRSSKDLVHWTKHTDSAFWDPADVSLKYRHMHWDDDFLKWTGFDTNDGKRYGTNWYSPSGKPQSWAPTVVKQDGRYYMLHGIITDSLSSGGSAHPAACISLSISDSPAGPFIPASRYNPELYSNSTLVRYVWTNINAQNSQIGYSECMNTAFENWENGFGCIDPEFVMDVSTGKLMEYDIGGNTCYAVTYGSWKGGIALVYIDSQTFKPVNQRTGEEMDAPLDTIRNNSGVLVAGGSGAAYEGAQLFYSSETAWYYIFVSMGDLNIEYRVGAGRSRNIEGPYADAGGLPMRFSNAGAASGYHAYGSKIIGAHRIGDGYGFKSPGGQSVLRDSDGRILFACHSRTDYMPNHFFTLQVRRMFFNSEGWPVLDMNEIYPGKSELSPLSMQDIAGTYDAVLTERNSAASVDGTATLSKEIVISEDGTVSGAYSGTFSFSGGNRIILDLKGLGKFSGIVTESAALSRRSPGRDSELFTVSFSALNSGKGSAKGEYIFGNRR